MPIPNDTRFAPYNAIAQIEDNPTLLGRFNAVPQFLRRRAIVRVATTMGCSVPRSNVEDQPHLLAGVPYLAERQAFRGDSAR